MRRRAPFPDSRVEAREAIVDAASEYQRLLGRRAKPYTQRTLTEAVCVVRRHRLVREATLVAAGFRPTERRAPRLRIRQLGSRR